MEIPSPRFAAALFAHSKSRLPLAIWLCSIGLQPARRICWCDISRPVYGRRDASVASLHVMRYRLPGHPLDGENYLDGSICASRSWIFARIESLWGWSFKALFSVRSAS